MAEEQRVWEWDVAGPFNPRYDANTTEVGLSYGRDIDGPFCGYDAQGMQTWEEFLALGPPDDFRMPAAIEADIRAHILARSTPPDWVATALAAAGRAERTDLGTVPSYVVGEIAPKGVVRIHFLEPVDASIANRLTAAVRGFVPMLGGLDWSARAPLCTIYADCWQAGEEMRRACYATPRS